MIESAGEMGRQDFSNVRKPSAVQNEIYKQMEANENRKFDRVGRPAAAGGDSIPEQIAQLDELRRRGVLTEAEFQAKKAELLDACSAVAGGHGAATPVTPLRDRGAALDERRRRSRRSPPREAGAAARRAGPRRCGRRARRARGW